ncbi:MAG: hypothetical protein M3400_00885 [Actinomycetota bacterium]|nr:hypothetical protein [Actinomycetota bacterium]
MHIRTRLAVAATCFALLPAACTGSGWGGGEGASEHGARATVQPTVSAPDTALTLIADTDPATAAISTSRALYDSSDVAVLVGSEEDAALTLGASAAVALGVPLLLTLPPTPAAPSPSPAPPVSTPSQSPAPGDDALRAELERLGVTSVLAIGLTSAQVLSAPEDAETVAVSADPAAVAEAISRDLGESEPVRPEDLAAAFAALDPDAPKALLPAGARASGQDSAGSSDNPRLPEVIRPEAAPGTLALATATPESLAGIATARAAGVDVHVVTPEQVDPRSSSEVITALSEAKPAAVIALGAGYGTAPGLDWKLATATTGTQFPGGGQLLFQERMFVALYGYTEGGTLGVLGEQDAEGAVQRAIETAAGYDDFVPTRVVPAFEIIATVASEFPGPDGNYSSESSIAQLQPWVDAAGAAGVYVVLDLQPGRTDFLTQAQAYEPLLRLPHVGLAMDPEWRLRPNQVHLRQIGSVAIAEVNAVVTWLADLTRANALPQKLLLLHQFLPEMIQDRELLDTSREELAVLIHVDGFGSPADKQTTWQTIRDAPPANVYWGWKNFVDEDLPLLTPEQTVEQAVPTPVFISYQ